jgi:hypothetical protein
VGGFDEREVGTVSSAYVSYAHGNGNLPIPNLDIESNIGGTGARSQQRKQSGATHDFVFPASEARSAFGSECDFALQEYIKDSAQIFEQSLASEWLNDFEAASIAGVGSSIPNTMQSLPEDRSIDPEFGGDPSQLLSGAPANDVHSSEPRIDAVSNLEPCGWTSPHHMGMHLNLTLVCQQTNRINESNGLADSPKRKSKSHLCHQCSTTFSCIGDLRCNSKLHSPEHRKFHCYIRD